MIKTLPLLPESFVGANSKRVKLWEAGFVMEAGQITLVKKSQTRHQGKSSAEFN